MHNTSHPPQHVTPPRSQIFLLDNSSKVILVDPLADTAEAVCARFAKKMGFQDPEVAGSYFQLYKSADGVTIDAPLAPTEQVWQAQRGCSKLIYMLQIFMNSLDTTDDPKVREREREREGAL